MTEPTDQDWIRFDVHATDMAAAAHVAMALREQLPAATIKSAPEDVAHQETLHCDAAIPDRTAAETEQAVKAAVRALPELVGPDAVAEVNFERHTVALGD